MRQKGFTLIELLAVIVILAIIALIATPMILGVIDSAKKGAAESSTYGYIDAIEKSEFQDMIDSGDYQSKKDGTYDLSTIGTVNYKGKGPSEICVVIKDGSVEVGSFQFESYIVDYNGKTAKVNKEKTEVSCVVTTEPVETAFNSDKGVNKPQLTEGMIPIKWDGSDWITTKENDSEWYDYETKNWANVATIDKTKVIDYSGNKNVGIVNGATQQSDGFAFDGVDDYIVIDKLKDYNFGNKISFVTKFNLKTINSSVVQGLFGNWENAGGGLSVDLNNTIRFHLHINGSYNRLYSTIPLEANKDYVVVGTYDGSQMKLYINGQLNNTLSVSGDILVSSVPFAIGANPNASSYMEYSDVIISDVGLYNTALSSTQISTNFSIEPKFIKENSLLIYNLRDERIFDNTILDIANMNTMWVWIPRYAYKITSGYHSSTTGTVDVKFLKGTSDNAVDGTSIKTADYVAGTNDTSMHYFTHPTFQNDINKLGFWVAKFEPTAVEGVANGYTSDWLCPVAGDNVSTKTIKVVPNVNSWRCISIANSYKVSIAMSSKKDASNNSYYGWNETSVDTHMATNLEWGAIYYLTLSPYGANTNEVYINNNQNYITGCAGDTASAGITTSTACTNPYNSATGVKASTTWNITGVYDMSGGSNEATMSVYNILSASSGFTEEELANMSLNHITKYTTPTANLLNNVGMDYDVTIYGDGIYETSTEANRYNGTKWVGTDRGGWDTEYSYLPYISGPWFARGTRFSHELLAGIGGFSSYMTNLNSHVTFRPIVSVLK